MLELAVKGNKWYWGWMVVLLGVIGAGFGLYLMQLKFGLGITGMSRDVSWGFYIANFTYLVGVAAGGVMVVLPYYLHDYKAYGKITILGEFLAIAAIVMCLLFILVDLGQPMRALNVLIVPDAQQRAVLRCHRAQRVPVPERGHRMERLGGRAQWCSLPELAQAVDLHLHSLGGEHSYGYRLSILRSARPSFLAHRCSGASFSGVRLCRRTGTADPALPVHPQVHQLRPG
jgi:hypothetical protein